MIKKYIFAVLVILTTISTITWAQDNVGIGTLTPNSKALLDLSSTDKGLLVPRLTTAQRIAIAPVGANDASLLVYDTDDNFFYFWNSTQWIPIPQLGSANISLTYNTTTGNLDLSDDGGTLTTNIPTNTDNQTLNLTGTDLAISNGNSVDLSGLIGSDDQNLTAATLSGNTLTIDIENGTSVSVDLSALIGSDDQNLTSATLLGTNLTIDIENGASVNVDLASLVGSDNQNLTAATLIGTNLTIDIEDGTSVSVDLANLIGTDDQNLTGATLAGTDLTIDIEDGTSVSVDLANLVGTDDQNLTGATLLNDTLTIEIEDGNPISVDLSDLGDDWKLLGNAGTNPATNFLGTTDNQDLVFRTNNIERLRTLASNGNVGIGTPAPLDRLQIQTNNSSIRLGTWSTNANYNLIDLKGTNNQDYNFLSSAADQTLFINRPAANDIRFRAGNVDQMVIRTGGNVGVATVNPQNRFDVFGAVAIGSYGGVNTAPANGLIVSGNVRIGITTAATIVPNLVDNGVIKFDQTGGYARIGNVNTDPNVGGVTPGSSFATGVGALAIGMNRNGGQSDVDFWNTTSHNRVAANNNDDRGFDWRRYNQTGNEQLLMSLNGLGNLTISGANYNTSDKRLKTEIKPFDNNVLDKVLQLQPSKYIKTNASLKDGEQIFNNDIPLSDFGFIAQEVYNVFPELVYKPKDETKELWAVDYARLSVMLTKAIQEQQAIIEELKNENDNLKASSSSNTNEMDALKSEIEMIKSFIFQEAKR